MQQAETQFTNTQAPQQDTYRKCPFCKQKVNQDRKVVTTIPAGEDEQGNPKREILVTAERCCSGGMVSEVSALPRPVGRRNRRKGTGRFAKIKFIPTAPGFRGTGRASRSPQLARTRRVRIAMAQASRRANRGA